MDVSPPMVCTAASSLVGLLALFSAIKPCHAVKSQEDDREQTCDEDSDLWIAPGAEVAITQSTWSPGKREGVRVVTGRFRAFPNRTTRANLSVIVVDGLSPSAKHLDGLHRKALSKCKKWSGIGAVKEEASETSAVACDDDRRTSADSEAAQKYLEKFHLDLAGAPLLEAVFGVDPAGFSCGLGKELLLLVAHAEMAPDSFHMDICADAPPGYKGLTVLTYPHDAWSSEWEGHFQLAGPRDRPMASFAPLPGRTIVIDGCIRHRSTKPTSEAVPLLKPVAVNSRFRQENAETGSRWFPQAASSVFPQLRFAAVAQLFCPISGENPTSLAQQ